MASDRDSGTAAGRSAIGPEGSSAEAAPTLQDPLAEALRLIEMAAARGLQVRLMGGLAFHAQVPSWTARIDRERRDIDLATRAKDRRGFTELMTSSGYLADKQYNALYGHKQLYFVDPERQRPVDVLIDRLEMCHTFEFADRLGVEARTLPLAELLLSKLQVALINRKDILDIVALLSEHPLATVDDGAINMARITALTSSDWGWWRTVTRNLERTRQFLASDVQPGELDFGRPPRFDAAAQADALERAIEEAPKSTRWRLRSRVGERVQWYQEPEEVGHGR
jgi:hypothetical protein